MNIDLDILQKQKELLIPVFTIFVSVLLIIFFIGPQGKDYFDERKKVNEALARLAILKKNQKSLESIDVKLQNEQVKKAIALFPLNKDYASILGAITMASVKTGVSLGDYSFKVGNLSEPQKNSTVPSFTIQLTVNSPIDGVRRFLRELYTTAPLSEVTDVRLSPSSSSISTVFYYQPLPSLILQYNKMVKIVSMDQSTLNTLSSWEGVNDSLQSPVLVISSASASLSPTPVLTPTVTPENQPLNIIRVGGLTQ